MYDCVQLRFSGLYRRYQVMRQNFPVSALDNKIFRNWGPSVFRRECDYSYGNLGHSRR